MTEERKVFSAKESAEIVSNYKKTIQFLSMEKFPDRLADVRKSLRPEEQALFDEAVRQLDEGELSDTRLSPIFEERLIDLKKANPELREPGRDEEVVKVSLAAQRFLKANDYQEAGPASDGLLDDIVRDAGLGRAERGEVRLLVGSFVDDLAKGVIDKAGRIIQPEELEEGSVVMHMPHKDKQTQTSINAKKAMYELGAKLTKLTGGRP